LPDALLRRTWQWHLLTMLRQTLKSATVNQLVDACFTKYPNGLGTTVHKGTSPRSLRCGALCGTDVVGPPIAVRRIDRYDGTGHVHDRSHRTERVERKRWMSTCWPHGATHHAQRVQAHPV
jgi:hypothetical protein